MTMVTCLYGYHFQPKEILNINKFGGVVSLKTVVQLTGESCTFRLTHCPADKLELKWLMFMCSVTDMSCWNFCHFTVCWSSKIICRFVCICVLSSCFESRKPDAGSLGLVCRTWQFPADVLHSIVGPRDGPKGNAPWMGGVPVLLLHGFPVSAVLYNRVIGACTNCMSLNSHWDFCQGRPDCSVYYLCCSAV